MSRRWVTLFAILLGLEGFRILGQVTQPGQSSARTSSHLAWTFETMLEYTNALRAADDRRYQEIFDHLKADAALMQLVTDRAVNKAEEAQQRVNATQNEFRGSIKDITDKLATKDSVTTLEARVVGLERIASGIEGRTSATGPIWGFAGTIIGAILIAAILSYIRPRSPSSKQ